MRTRTAGFVALFLGVAATAALAQLDVTLGNGDAVRGTLLPADETETFRFACPEGARFSVTVKPHRPLKRVGATLFDAAGLPVEGRTGRRLRWKGVGGADPGEIRVEVTGGDGVATGDYTLRVRWRSPRKFHGSAPVDGSGSGSLAFPAAGGAVVHLSAAPPRGPPAGPPPPPPRAADGAETALEPGASGTFVAPATGTYTLEFENTAEAAGGVRARARVRAPAPPARRLFATTREIPPGTDIRASAVLDAGGGFLQAPGSGPLAGARVTVPPGALAGPAIVVLGAVPDLEPPLPSRSVRATVAAFVGPLGPDFGAALRPSVEVPLTPAPGAAEGSLLRMYGGDGEAPVEEVPGAVLDGGTSRITFEAPRPERFQAWYVAQPELAEPVVLELPQGESFTMAAVGGGFAFLGSPVAPGPGGEAQAGLVRVYEHVGETWIERAPLRAPAPAAGDTFGMSVVYRRSPAGPADDSLLVGLSRRDLPGKPDAGGIMEFARSGSGWAFRTEVMHPFPGTYAMFGETMAVEGDRLVAPSVGLQVYARTAAGWDHVETVTSAGAWNEVYYAGHPVVMDGGDLAVGVLSDSARYGGGHQAGSVYLYAPSGSSVAPAGSVTDPDPAVRNTGFGTGVALAAEDLAVYAPSLDPAIRLFARDGLAPSGSIARPIDPVLQNRSPVLTGSIAARGDRLFVGARSDLAGYPFAGVHVFRKVMGVWQQEMTLDGSPLLAPDAREQTFSWSFAVDDDTLVLPMSAYHYDTQQTRVALAFFDLTAE